MAQDEVRPGDEVPPGVEVRGVGIGSGLAIGPVLTMSGARPAIAEDRGSRNAAEELARAEAALATVTADLSSRAAAATGAARDVLDAQSMMAEDPSIIELVHASIDGGRSAERAVVDAFASFHDQLVALGGYMAARAADLDDVSDRIIAELTGIPVAAIPNPDYPFILVARDLAPADTAHLDLSRVLAVVTLEGGPSSHTAILAREKGLVAIVGASGAGSLVDGDLVIVDAGAGVVTIAPTPEQIDRAHAQMAALAARVSEPVHPGALADGTRIPLMANLGSTTGMEAARESGAEGVGLFRTEFLFLGAATAPTQQTQHEHYAHLLSGFPGQKVVVRLLDAGADKPLAFLSPGPEENPALGVRGIRALRLHEAVLSTQLAALASAARDADAHLWVMAPMVTTVDDARYFVDAAHEAGLPTAGVMIEVPAAALMADAIVAVADFVSIGTNDLTQYTLAADRQLGALAPFQDPWHPAVLKLVQAVGAAGKEAGKPVGICGEAAADPLLALVLVGLGATSLSMSIPALSDVRHELARHSAAAAVAAAAAALGADDAASAKAAAAAVLAERTPD